MMQNFFNHLHTLYVKLPFCFISIASKIVSSAELFLFRVPEKNIFIYKKGKAHPI